jgi:hypothetical protein
MSALKNRRSCHQPCQDPRLRGRKWPFAAPTPPPPVGRCEGQECKRLRLCQFHHMCCCATAQSPPSNHLASSLIEYLTTARCFPSLSAARGPVLCLPSQIAVWKRPPSRHAPRPKAKDTQEGGHDAPHWPRRCQSARRRSRRARIRRAMRLMSTLERGRLDEGRITQRRSLRCGLVARKHLVFKPAPPYLSHCCTVAHALLSCSCPPD